MLPLSILFVLGALIPSIYSFLHEIGHIPDFKHFALSNGREVYVVLSDRTHEEAIKYCKQLPGGDLATVRDQVEASEIGEQIRRIYGFTRWFGVLTYWTGGKWNNATKMWEWPDGTSANVIDATGAYSRCDNERLVLKVTSNEGHLAGNCYDRAMFFLCSTGGKLH